MHPHDLDQSKSRGRQNRAPAVGERVSHEATTQVNIPGARRAVPNRTPTVA